MESSGSLTLSSDDHAIRLDLILKVHTISKAEDYYAGLTNNRSRKAASSFLLHYYVKERNVSKAEALMESLQNMGLAVNPHMFNEMMKLYMATSQCGKVPIVIRDMKKGKIPLNVLSYNVWISACNEVYGLAYVDMVYKEMTSDKNVEVGWSTYVTLANIYKKYGFKQKAVSVLKLAEGKLSTRSRLAYMFIMTNYANLGDRDGVIRLWDASKHVPGRVTCANYMCIISCLVKVGDIKEAEKVFRTWESNLRRYDIRVSNVLLGVYMREGLIEKAEALHVRTLRKGGKPNYKTWEILMEGYVKTELMDKAVDAMNKALSMLEDCVWRPSLEIVMAIADYIAEKGKTSDLLKLVEVLQPMGLVSLALYKLVLRVHVGAGKDVRHVVNMMVRDKFGLDEEVRNFISRSSMVNIPDISCT